MSRELELRVALATAENRLDLLMENITVSRQGDDLNIGVRIGTNYEPARKSTARQRKDYIKRMDAVLHARAVWRRKRGGL